jgi:hypothetical protein
MKRITSAGLILVLALPALAWAGSAGHPAGTIGDDNFGCTLEVEEQIKELDNDLAKSRRYLGKLIWGATDRLDIYARLGTSNLRVESSGYPEFKGDQGMTWGGGATIMAFGFQEARVSTYVDVQYLSYFSDGEILVSRSEGGDQWTDRFRDRYKWHEFQISFFAAWHREIFTPYAGFGVTNVFGEVERDLSMLWGEDAVHVSSDRNEFREDMVPELILGMDFALGGKGRLSGEVRYSDNQDISFFIGVSELSR